MQHYYNQYLNVTVNHYNKHFKAVMNLSITNSLLSNMYIESMNYDTVQTQVNTCEHFTLNPSRSIYTQTASRMVSTCKSFSHGE